MTGPFGCTWKEKLAQGEIRCISYKRPASPVMAPGPPVVESYDEAGQVGEDAHDEEDPGELVGGHGSGIGADDEGGNPHF